MAVSIVHRATGTGMATVGTFLFVWWLSAMASGPAAYGAFVDLFTLSSGKLNIAGYIFGIGLSLSARLAELHGGHIEARSDGQGQGAEFTLVLPRGGPAAPVAREEAEPVRNTA